MAESMIDAGLPVVGLGLNPALPMLDHMPDWMIGSPLLCWNTRPELRRRVGGSGFIHLVSSPFGVSDVSASGVFPAWLEDDGVVTATVVYDLIPFLFPDHYATDEATQRFLDERRDLVTGSDLLLAISERTRDDIIDHWNVEPDKVINIGAPRPAAFIPATTGPTARSAPGRYVLAPVGYEWRKEPSKLIEGWGRVPRPSRRGRRLVLVGEAPDGVRADWAKMARRSGLKRGEVEILGRVGDGTLLSLYSAAELVVHGSRYEGYGLPVLEASMCGAPSITSDTGALPEILDLRESVFDPESPDEIASSIVRALEGGSDRAAIVSAASRVASNDDQFASKVQSALASVPAPGSWAPTSSVLLVGGNTELAESFQRSGHPVTLIPRDLLGAPDVVLAASHDHVVHVITDDEHDTQVLRWATAVPGAVICRRSDLSALWIELARDEAASDEDALDRLHEVIRRSYRGAHPPSLPAGDLLDVRAWNLLGVRGFGALIAVSPSTAVHPEFLDAVRRDAGPLLQGRVVAFDESAPELILGPDF